MLIIRVLVVLALLSIGGALIAWMLTGDRRFLKWALRAFQAGLVVVFGFLALLFIERALIAI